MSNHRPSTPAKMQSWVLMLPSTAFANDIETCSKQAQLYHNNTCFTYCYRPSTIMHLPEHPGPSSIMHLPEHPLHKALLGFDRFLRMLQLALQHQCCTCLYSCLQDWWWKARLGKCYYQLGMLRDAEKQFLSALKTADMVTIVLELSKVAFETPFMRFVHVLLPPSHVLLAACDSRQVPFIPQSMKKLRAHWELQLGSGWLRCIYAWTSHRQHCSSTLRQQHGSQAR